MFKRLNNFFGTKERTVIRSSRLIEKAREIIAPELATTEFGIKLQNRELVISIASSHARNELFLKREALLEKLREHFGASSVSVITVRKS